ncbi:putative serine/threonine-protein kinase [Heracleum sosnowskyi]|uniref:non-specific serine/threonine protein kinase n=1 Tax=Heracleum sosnowskyi TaxID=360622 RepID=A0AAD8H7B5_9APIA|nr:putative serine/threonine-protein kinase [Heracleum sosnowskyi]
MSFNSVTSSTVKNLSTTTSFFGLKLWPVILICIAIFILLLVLLKISCACCPRSSKYGDYQLNKSECTGNAVSKTTSSSMLLSRNALPLEFDIESSGGQWSSREGYKCCDTKSVQLKHCNSIGGIKQYTIEEIETATNGFADENVIGSGDYGIVYRGLLFDHSRVAIKKLVFNNAKSMDFIQEVEAMWCIRHKNMVKLIGYCTEGTYKMLVYEYVDNGNLQHWLHGTLGDVSTLTWNTRMNIILGIVKCLVYLHEDTEPPIVHQNLKSSNILVDRQWNPKVSDFGLSKLLGPDWTLSLARPTGTSGYMAPEYCITRVLDEKTDVYSVGVLIIEIISGRSPVERRGDKNEGNLVEWLNSMVRDQNAIQLVDPKLGEKPNKKELKRIVLIALRCVDEDAENRPKMGDIIHMLEPRDLLLSDEHVINRDFSLQS